MNNIVKLAVKNLVMIFISIFLVFIIASLMNKTIDSAASKFYILFFDSNIKERNVLFHAAFNFITQIILFIIFYLLTRKILGRFIK